jgi:Zn-finger nucleic acid-binding protein
MTVREGIEIDYCPTCRGVWLDRGELDKIIERSLRSDREVPPCPTGMANAATPYDLERNGYSDHHDKHRREGHDGHYGQRRSLWKDLFD